MRISEEILDHFTIQYPIENIAPLEDILFLDIETTGFTARSSQLYLVGCAYYNQNQWKTIQWLAESPDQESEILIRFFDFAKSFKYMVHFNGNNFDLPYITQKCEQLSLPYNFHNFQGIDLYKRIAPYKYFLKLPNCKQKTIEQFLGIDRKDIFSGGELIGIYQDYIQTPSEYAANSLLLHNADDLKGMLQALPILAYYDLFNQPIKAKKVQANSYKDVYGNVRKELIITIHTETPLPQPVSTNINGCYFRGEGQECNVKIPIYEEELKFFYANYQDYYYLPTEDVALHKSVAGFVDKSHRVPATASTCYTRKWSTYLPQWNVVFEPFFKRDYKSKELFFELTDELKKNRNAFSTYAAHVLSMMASIY